MYIELRRSYASDWEKWNAFRQEKVSVFMKLLQEGIDSGAIRNVNSEVFYQCISAAITAIADPEFLERCDLTYSQAVDTLQDIVFNGILA